MKLKNIKQQNKNNADIKFVAKGNLIFKRDEKIIINIYRFIKKHWEFFAGIISCLIILGLIYI